MAAISHSIEIKTTPDKVYQAITSQEGLAGWWTPETMIKPEIGFIGVFTFKGEAHTEMKITKLIPNERVEWECINGLEDWVGTTFSFALVERRGTTMVHFTNAAWKEENIMFKMISIHWQRYMLSLKCLCEFGNGMPYGS